MLNLHVSCDVKFWIYIPMLFIVNGPLGRPTKAFYIQDYNLQYYSNSSTESITFEPYLTQVLGHIWQDLPPSQNIFFSGLCETKQS